METWNYEPKYNPMIQFFLSENAQVLATIEHNFQERNALSTYSELFSSSSLCRSVNSVQDVIEMVELNRSPIPHELSR